MTWISLWKVCNGTCILCALYSRSSGWEFCLSKGIRFSLENNKPLFPAGASTSFPPKYIRSLTIFRHEGWCFGGKKGHSSGFNRFKVNFVLFCIKSFSVTEFREYLCLNGWSMGCLPKPRREQQPHGMDPQPSARNWTLQSWFCQALPTFWSKGLAGQSSFQETADWFWGS